MECNNKSNCHNMHIISDGDTAQRVVCTHCHTQYVIRKHHVKGNPEARQYAKLFKRDILQGNDNLFYKYYPQHLRT